MQNPLIWHVELVKLFNLKRQVKQDITVPKFELRRGLRGYKSHLGKKVSSF